MLTTKNLKKLEKSPEIRQFPGKWWTLGGSNP